MKVWKVKAEYEDGTMVEKEFPYATEYLPITEEQEQEKIKEFLANYHEDLKAVDIVRGESAE